MSKRTKFKLLILAAVLCFSVSLFAGCVGELHVNDFLNQNNALNQQVTYYSNGGYFDGTNNIVEKNVYYHVNDIVITNFDAIQGKSIRREDFVFAGWYYAELTDKLDEEGNPELDADGNHILVPVFEDEEKKIVKSTTRRLEDNLKIQQNTHLYVCAHWEKDVELQFVLVSDGPVTLKSGERVNPGEVIASKRFVSGSASVGTAAPAESTDFTFLQCYSNPECTIPAPYSVSKPSGEDAQARATVYAKYIEGVWTVVRNKSDVGRMFFNIYTDTKFYILNDIDCSNERFNPQPRTRSSNCYIEGNGKTLSNLKFEYPVGTGIDAGGTYSIFGTFGENAEIKNLVMDNVTVSYTTRVNVNGLYFFCAGDNGAKFENFTLRNVSMEVDSANTVPNIQLIDGVYQSGSWLFGNVSTDAEYTKTGTGKLVIEGKKLTVQGVVVVDEPATGAQ